MHFPEAQKPILTGITVVRRHSERLERRDEYNHREIALALQNAGLLGFQELIFHYRSPNGSGIDDVHVRDEHGDIRQEERIILASISAA